VLSAREFALMLDEALLPRVFDRFFRANAQIEGSGLGLSVVQAIVNRYDGKASLRNRTDGQSGIDASMPGPVSTTSIHTMLLRTSTLRSTLPPSGV